MEYKPTDVLTDEQVATIKENLFYNYYILYCAIRAFGIEDKLLGEKEKKNGTEEDRRYRKGITDNEFVRVMIEEALAYEDELKGKKKYTLMDRLYEKTDDGKYLRITCKADTEVVPSGFTLVRKIIDLFGFDCYVWYGKRKINLGITVPNDVRLGLDKYIDIFVQFKKWCSKIRDKDANCEYSVELDNNLGVDKIRDIFENKKAAYKNVCDKIMYDPLDINPVYAYIYSLVSGEILRKYPGFIKPAESYKLFNFDSLVDHLKYMIDSSTSSKKKALLSSIIDDAKSQSGLPEGKSEYIINLLNEKLDEDSYDDLMIDLCSEAQDLLYNKLFGPYTERKYLTNNNTKYAYSPRTNVYSMSIIIYFIVYNLAWYREESRLIRTTSWRFLNRYDPVEPNEPTEIEFSYLVPTPLEIDSDSELLRLIKNIDDIGIVFTLKDEEKEIISLKSYTPDSTPYFNKEDIGGVYGK